MFRVQIAGLFGNGRSCTIKNVQVDGYIKLNNGYAAGILAMEVIYLNNQMTPTLITNCTSMVNIETFYGNIGGIAGIVTNAIIENCVNMGTLSVNNSFTYVDYFPVYIGGIVANCSNNQHRTTPNKIINCINVGNITGVKTNPASIH